MNHFCCSNTIALPINIHLSVLIIYRSKIILPKCTNKQPFFLKLAYIIQVSRCTRLECEVGQSHHDVSTVKLPVLSLRCRGVRRNVSLSQTVLGCLHDPDISVSCLQKCLKISDQIHCYTFIPLLNNPLKYNQAKMHFHFFLVLNTKQDFK